MRHIRDFTLQRALSGASTIVLLMWWFEVTASCLHSRSHSLLGFWSRRQFLSAAAIPTDSTGPSPSTAPHPIITTTLLKGLGAVDRLTSKAKLPHSPVTDGPLFRDWIKSVVKRKLVTDPEFRCRVDVRDLRKAASPTLQNVEKKVYDARQLYDLHEHSATLNRLDALILGATQAVASIEKFVKASEEPATGTVENEKTAAKIANVKILLPEKRKELASSLQERDALREDCVEWQDLQRCIAEMTEYHQSIGLTESMLTLKHDVQVKAGHGRNDRGRSFENTCADVLSTTLLPMLSSRTGIPCEEMIVIKNVKLGMASTKGTASEFDSIVCTRITPDTHSNATLFSKYKTKGSFVIVLGVVEMKRNPDDLGDSFAGYQKSLSWLARVDGSYEPEQWVTRAYPKGHFDRAFVQEHKGESLVFTSESFRGLQRTHIDSLTATASVNEDAEEETKSEESWRSLNLPELFIQDLYFVSKDGDIELIPSKALSWTIAKVGQDERLGPLDQVEDEDALEDLRLQVVERYPPRMSTLDLLRLWKRAGTQTDQYGQLILIREERKSPTS